jgi:hypothetical protein
MPKKKQPELTLAAIGRLMHAPPIAEAQWCLVCGQVRLGAEGKLQEGDRLCSEELSLGTPMQCLEAFERA